MNVEDRVFFAREEGLCGIFLLYILYGSSRS
jgi:hypothetical protein